jgi:hypothetical protein
MERSGTHTGHDGGSFEQTFQIMVVVLNSGRMERDFFERRTWPLHNSIPRWYESPVPVRCRPIRELKRNTH